MKILIVEDNPIHRKLADAVLTSEGYQVEHADSAEKAESAIEAQAPEVIIMDLSLPGIDGLSLLQKIKANPATRQIVVIAVTGYPSKWTKKQALEVGCDAYLVKPIDINELIENVAKVTGKK